MSLFFFTDRRVELLEICHTDENIIFLEKIFLIFHQIFLYRIQSLVLDIDQYIDLSYIKSPDSFDNIRSITRYHIYRDIIDVVQKEDILYQNFQYFNSYEKISYETFTHLMIGKIPNIDILQFWLLFQSQEHGELQALDMRLLADFELTQIWYEHMEQLRRGFTDSSIESLKSTTL